MKKLIAWFLVLAMCFSTFAACGQEATPTTQPTEPASTEEPAVENVGNPEALASVLEYLTTIYKDAGGLTPKDFTRIGTIPFGTDKYEVVWTASVGEDLVKIVRGEDGMVTIDVNEECDVETPYTLTATITDAAGNSVSHSWEHVLPAAMNVADILDAAYALESGASLAYEVTLTGKVVSVDDLWSDKYGNITVTIAMEGHEDRPVKCYRLAGDGAKDLAVGDTITVTGTITNYKGIIEFAQGCTLDSRISGGGEAPTAVVYEYYRPFPDGTVLLIYNRQYNMALSEKKTGFYNVGVKRSSYGATEVWTAILHSDGTYSFANADGETIGLGSEYGSLNLGEKYDRWGIIKLDCGKFLIENAGRKGMFLEWYADCNNFSTYNKYAPETDPQFIMNFIFLDEDEIPEEEEEPVYTLAPEMVTSPVADTPYKMYVEQENLDKVLYFTGKTANKDYYLATTENPEEAIDVYVETVEGGYRLYFLDGETKVYIDSYKNGNYENARLTTEPTAVYTYDSTYNTYVTTVEGNDTYIGAYSGYETLSVSKYSFIATSFPSHLGVLVEKEAATLESIAISGTAEYTVGDTLALTVTATYSDGDTKDVTELAELSGYDMSVAGEYTVTASYDGKTAEYKITVAEAPAGGEEEDAFPYEIGKAYKLYVNQETLGKNLYFTGETANKNYYLATAETTATAADVFVEEVDGGYRLYFMNGETKTYIDVYASGSYVNARLTDTPSAVYTYDSEYDTFVTVVNNTDYYVGTYSTFNTLSASKYSFIATSFPAHLIAVDEIPVTLTGITVTAPTKTTYTVGDTFDPTGLVVTATYSDGTTKEVTGYTLSDVDMTTAGTKTVTVTYEDKTATFEITVNAAEGDDSGEIYSATITFDTLEKITNTDRSAEQIWEENGIVFTYSKGTSTQFKEYADPIRCYANTDIAIAYKGMVKIDFTTSYSTYTNNLTDHLNKEEIAYTVDGDVVTVEFEEAKDEFVLTTLYKQVRFVSITVYSTEAGESGGESGDEIGETTTVSVVLKDYATDNGWEDTTRYDSLKMDDVVQVTVDGTATGSWGLNSGKYYNNGYAWRIYQNESPAITVSAEGKTIVSVKITYTVSNTGVLTLNGEQVASDTVVEVNASSITFSVGNTGTKTNGQVRITAIEVVYG